LRGSCFGPRGMCCLLFFFLNWAVRSLGRGSSLLFATPISFVVGHLLFPFFFFVGYRVDGRRPGAPAAGEAFFFSLFPPPAPFLNLIHVLGDLTTRCMRVFCLCFLCDGDFPGLFFLLSSKNVLPLDCLVKVSFFPPTKELDLAAGFRPPKRCFFSPPVAVFFLFLVEDTILPLLLVETAICALSPNGFVVKVFSFPRLSSFFPPAPPIQLFSFLFETGPAFFRRDMNGTNAQKASPSVPFKRTWAHLTIYFPPWCKSAPPPLVISLLPHLPLCGTFSPFCLKRPRPENDPTPPRTFPSFPYPHLKWSSFLPPGRRAAPCQAGFFSPSTPGKAVHRITSLFSFPTACSDLPPSFFC